MYHSNLYHMKKNLPIVSVLSLLLLSLLFTACAPSKQASSSSTSAKKETTPTLKNERTFLISQVSTDKNYGYTEKKPIKVGKSGGSGPLNEQRFLNALAGPNGEEIQYERLGSCCSFKTDNGFMGAGLLDRYQVTWKGQKEKVILYINMYDYEPLKAPVGFTIL